MLANYIQKGFVEPMTTREDARQNICCAVAIYEVGLHENKYVSSNELFAMKINAVKFISGKEIAQIHGKIIIEGWRELLENEIRI